MVKLNCLVYALTLSERGPSLYVRICRRQILTVTYKDGPRSGKNKIFLMAVDP